MPSPSPSPSPSHPRTLAPSHPLTLSPSHPRTLSPSHPLTLALSHPHILSPVLISPLIALLLHHLSHADHPALPALPASPHTSTPLPRASRGSHTPHDYLIHPPPSHAAYGFSPAGMRALGELVLDIANHDCAHELQLPVFISATFLELVPTSVHESTDGTACFEWSATIALSSLPPLTLEYTDCYSRRSTPCARPCPSHSTPPPPPPDCPALSSCA